MIQFSISKAKLNLPEIGEILENGNEDCVIITRRGKPYLKITLADQPDVSKRIGIAKTTFPYVNMDVFNMLDEEISKDFYEE